MEQVQVYCWASGLLEIGTQCPRGALPLVSGKKEAVVDALNALATKPYEGNDWLLPKNAAWIEAVRLNDEEAAQNAMFESMMDFRARLVRVLGA